MKKQAKICLFISFVILLTVAAVICWYVYESTIHRAGAIVADQVGLDQESDNLHIKAVNLELKASAEKAFGSDVVWVEIPDRDFEQAYRIIMDRVPRGMTFSYRRVATDKLGMYVSRGILEKLSEEIKSLENK